MCKLTNIYCNLSKWEIISSSLFFIPVDAHRSSLYDSVIRSHVYTSGCLRLVTFTCSRLFVAALYVHTTSFVYRTAKYSRVYGCRLCRWGLAISSSIPLIWCVGSPEITPDLKSSSAPIVVTLQLDYVRLSQLMYFVIILYLLAYMMYGFGVTNWSI
jgi:hypothetical protein